MSETRSDAEYQRDMTQLLQDNRYSLDQTALLKALEGFARHQLSHPGAYDLGCNMHVLKSYQLEPQLTNLDLVAGILAKALTRLPSTDFLVSTFVLSESVQQHPSVAAVIELGKLLESASFAEFWTKLAAQRSLVDSVVGFDDSIRQFVFHVVASSYKVIAKDLLAEFANLSVQQLNDVAAQKNWAVAADTYTLPTNEATDLATAPIENIQLSQLFPIIAHLK